jgi:hypothetical protein
VASAARPRSDYDPERLLAGHLLRHITFGPTENEIAAGLRVGRASYVAEQLDPSRIDDPRVAPPYLQPFDPRDAGSYESLVT